MVLSGTDVIWEWTSSKSPISMGEFGIPTNKVPVRQPMQKYKCKRNPRTALTIKGKTFSQYLEKRLLVDNLGFKPTNEFMDGSTDCSTFIASIVPQTPKEFLVYVHELGHCKSKQWAQEFRNMFNTGVCDNSLENELNAWVWGLRYFRRLGFTLCREGKELVAKAFSSYADLNKNNSLVQNCWNTLYEKFGIQAPSNKTHHRGYISGPMILHGYLDTSKPKSKPSKEKPAGWEPWHEIKWKQMKKQWKNQR